MRRHDHNGGKRAPTACHALECREEVPAERGHSDGSGSIAMDARASRYHEVYARWQRDPQGFWGEAAQAIDWIEPPRQDLRSRRPASTAAGSSAASATPAGTRSTATCCSGRGEQAALIYDSPVTGQKQTISYADLQTKTQVLAGILKELRRQKGRPRHPLHADGAGGGDRHARLRAHRRGALGGVRRLRGERARHPHRRRQAEGHPLRELRHRGGPRRPYKPLLDEAIELATHKPEACLILQRPQVRSDARRRAAITTGTRCATRRWSGRKLGLDCVPVAATDPLYILYTSGTTGRPKGVVRDNGGHMVALKWSMQNLYGVEPGEV